MRSTSSSSESTTRAGATPVGRVPIVAGKNAENEAYLEAKQAKLGHVLGLVR